MEEKKLNLNFGELLLLLPASIIIGIGYWLCLPALTNRGLGWFVAIVLLIVGIIEWAICYDRDFDGIFERVVVYGQMIVAAVAIVALMIAGICSGPMFNHKIYSNSMVVEDGNAEEDIPDFADVSKIALMDTDSAKKLGDRKLGTLSEYVNQYKLSTYYTTISYNGRVVKVAPLEYSDFFSAKNNPTIPGYVIVDALTNEATFVEVKDGMKYSPSAFFKNDLGRHIRSEYKSEKLGSYVNFQMDEEGTPYFAVAVLEYAVGIKCKVPTGAILVNAVTGEMEKYPLSELPTWVEQVVDGDMVEALYNRHGRYINGFWNLSDTGKTQTTDDYGYIEKDGDIYIYTGITSVVADESNVGFIMVNTRTGECKYYAIPGAEEYSAKAAAEGVVQNFGYVSSFPSLVMYGDEPTYVMAMKDANSLVKMYAMVNMKNYTIVAVEENLQECQKSYVKAMAKAGSAADVEVEGIESLKETITIAAIEFINVEGETIVYVKTEDGRVFKQAFAENENLILLDLGDEVEIEYVELETITAATINI